MLLKRIANHQADPIGSGSQKEPSASVAVVIPTFNRTTYLRDALRSVFEQTRAADEVIVVDDGSDEDPTALVAEFPGVRLIRQENQGPSAARNAGIRAAKSDYVLCLDSDDVLVPTGIENNLACLAENPGVAFVYGAHQRVDANLRPMDRPYFTAMPRFAYHDLLQNNSVYVPGAALFDRAKLLEVGGFDARFRRSEDYDLFLRLARKYPVAGDPALVMKYRMHGSNLSANSSEMLAAALTLQERNRPEEGDATAMRAYRRGRKMLVRTFALGAWQSRPEVSPRRKWEERLRIARVAPFASLAAAVWQFSRRHLPHSTVEHLKQVLRNQAPAVGRVDLGDLRRTRPISKHSGDDRGTPIDRFYLEKFLTRYASDISGRVLEVGDDGYSRQFGSNITRQDVLDAQAGNPRATIVGDLSQAGALPEAAFDCLLINDTLQRIYDVPGAVREMWRGLRPGGVALVTMPGIAAARQDEFPQFWAFSALAATRVFADVFGGENVEVETFGNVYAVTCFLQGLAVEEVELAWLDKHDPKFPIVVAIRARRAR